MARVVLENIYKSFPQQTRSSAATAPSAVESPVDLAMPSGDVRVLRRINLTIHDGEFLVLVGPSGCGKSTLLRLIAGLEALTAGNIWVGDRLVNALPPKQRNIAMVFQSYALYPHMTVYNNLAFGLRRTQNHAREPFEEKPFPTGLAQRPQTAWTEDWLSAITRSLPPQFRYWSAKERSVDRRVRTIAQQLQIEGLLDRLPKQLSGGQKQRVALGRAMARNPQVFLMDEPLSNLDAKLRTETRAQIVQLQRQLGITTIYVTHDQTEAMTMGDRIAVMNAGEIQQLASPLELYHHPANRFVAAFIGSPPMNFLPVYIKAPLVVHHPLFRLTLPDLWEPVLRQRDGQELILGIRPEHLSIGAAAPKNLPVRVERVEALGSETYLSAHWDSDEPVEPATLNARIDPDRPIALGESLWLSLAVEKIHLFEPDTGEAIVP